MEVSEDPMARSNDARALAFDERAKRLAVTREDSIDDVLFVVAEGRRGWVGCEDRLVPPG